MAEKKDWASGLSVQEKVSLVEPDHSQLSVSRQCDLLGLPRSSYYRCARAAEGKAEDLALMGLIDELYTKHPFYGTRKVRDHLRRQGHRINRKKVQRLMRLMGLQSVAPKPNTSQPAPWHVVYPYRLRGLTINRPGQVWCTDITYGVPGVQGKHGCLNEPRTCLKYTS